MIKDFFKKLFGSNNEREAAQGTDAQPYPGQGSFKEEERPDLDVSNRLNPLAMYGLFMISNEAAYRNQAIIMRRSYDSDRIKLGEVLSEIFKLTQADIKSLFVVERHTLAYSTETRTVTDISQIWTLDLFACILKEKVDGHYTMGSSTDVTLIVSTATSRIVLNLRSLWGDFAIKYIRISALIPDNSKTDDLRSQRSENAPQATSFILSNAERGYERSLALFEQIKDSVAQKQQRDEKLEDGELHYVHGIMEFQFADYAGYGFELFRQKRYHDCYEILSRFFHFYKKLIHRGTKKDKDIFCEVCRVIGTCLSKLNREEEALHYFTIAGQEHYIRSLSRTGESTASDLASDYDLSPEIKYGNNIKKNAEDEPHLSGYVGLELSKFKTRFEQQIEQTPAVNGAISILDLLHTLLGLESYNILPNMVVYDNETMAVVETIEENEEIAKYILNSETGMNKTLILAVSHWRSVTNNGDESRLSQICTLVLSTHQIHSSDSGKRMRLDLVRANFPENDDKREIGRVNVPVNNTVILGMAPRETFGTTKEECIKCFHFAKKLKEESRTIEAAKYYKWAFDNTRNLAKSANGTKYVDHELETLFRDCAYDLGFCFVENQLYDLAFYYLAVARMSGEVGATEEYINCLANSKSPLALESIERCLDGATNIRATSAEQIERWEFYVAFLKRRQVWVLIELEEFNRAKRLLQPLLEDPRCKDFAEKELRFLETLRQRESNQTQG